MPDPIDHDHAFYERELASFLPDRIFDAHAHAWAPGSGLGSTPLEPTTGVDYATYRQLMQDLHPDRQTAALFIPVFNAQAPARHEQDNAWIASVVACDRESRGLFFVHPADDPEWVRQEVRRLKLHGLKCYHTMASRPRTWEADIPEYLPEPLVKVAHEEGWVITLHLVKARAVADPSNQHWIRHYCQTYPNMTLILAHSARGFQPAHNLEGLPRLTDLANLYFDTSANCEPMAHQAILRLFGHEKLMYGSDLPVSHQRGRSLAAADSFLWLYEGSPVWGEKHLRIEPVRIGLEHLRSLKWACWSERLSDRQIEDIFWNNAAKLLGLSSWQTNSD